MKGYKMKITGIFALCFICSLLLPMHAATEGEYEKTLIYRQDTDRQKITMVFMSEGYKQSEQGKFMKDVKRMTEGIFKNKAFSQDKDKFEIYALWIPTESYSFHTYFKEKLIFMPDWNAPKRMMQSQIATADIGVLLINSAAYGGRGPEDVAITTVDHPYAIDVLLHELGHAYAGLVDEYANTFGADPGNAPNIATDPGNVPWQAWMGKPDIGCYPLPNAPGYYKPSQSCKMNLCWEQDFCTVCLESIRSTTQKLYEAQPGIALNLSPLHAKQDLDMSPILKPEDDLSIGRKFNRLHTDIQSQAQAGTSDGQTSEPKPLLPNPTEQRNALAMSSWTPAPHASIGNIEQTTLLSQEPNAATEGIHTQQQRGDVALTAIPKLAQANPAEMPKVASENSYISYWGVLSAMLLGCLPFLKPWFS